MGSGWRNHLSGCRRAPAQTSSRLFFQTVSDCRLLQTVLTMAPPRPSGHVVWPWRQALPYQRHTAVSLLQPPLTLVVVSMLHERGVQQIDWHWQASPQVKSRSVAPSVTTPRVTATIDSRQEPAGPRAKNGLRSPPTYLQQIRSWDVRTRSCDDERANLFVVVWLESWS